MFSSTNNDTINPLAINLPPHLSDHETINATSLHEIHCSNHPFMAEYSFPVSNPQISPSSLINYMSLSSHNDMLNDHHHQHHQQNIMESGCSSFSRGKKPVKKDRHSKICTAQGLRDRRVRLSIGIAREFFDLQDMLGFDKASKTLEWLLKKSRKAIKELAQTKKDHGGSFDNNFGGDTDENKSFMSGSSSEYCEEVISNTNKMDTSGSKQWKRSEKSELHLLVKESRAKARERARERTKEKMCSKWMDEPKACPGIIQTLEAQEKSTKVHGHKNMASCYYEQANEEDLNRFPGQDVFEESISIRRKLKAFSVPGYNQQNGGNKSKDSSFSNSSSSNNYNVTNWPQNGDMNSNPFADSGAFYGVTNMNLTTGLQIYGNPW